MKWILERAVRWKNRGTEAKSLLGNKKREGVLGLGSFFGRDRKTQPSVRGQQLREMWPTVKLMKVDSAERSGQYSRRACLSGQKARSSLQRVRQRAAPPKHEPWCVRWATQAGGAWRMTGRAGELAT